MQRLNQNTTLIKESELRNIVEGIVRQNLQEQQLNEFNAKKVAKKVGKGIATVGGAAALTTGALFGKAAYDEKHEPVDNDQTMGAHEFKKDSTGNVKEIPVHKASTQDKQIRATESLHLTPSQLQQVIRESVCTILQEQGYRIGEQMLDEASRWQNMKAGVKALKNPLRWKQNYNAHVGNYETQNASNALAKQREAQRKLNANLDNQLAQVGNKKVGGFLGFGKRNQTPEEIENAKKEIWNNYNSQSQVLRNNMNNDYNRFLDASDRRWSNAKGAKNIQRSKLGSNDYGLAAYQEPEYNQMMTDRQNNDAATLKQSNDWNNQFATQTRAEQDLANQQQMLQRQAALQKQQERLNKKYNPSAGGGAVGGGNPSNP